MLRKTIKSLVFFLVVFMLVSPSEGAEKYPDRPID